MSDEPTSLTLGIVGAACAEAFSKKGHSLLLLARRVEKCEALKVGSRSSHP